MLEDIRNYMESMEEEAIPQLSINCVIMGFHERKLKVIVNKITLGKNKLMLLPGGYVKQSEDLSDAVERIVKESTGLEDILFKQFAVFGKASRSFVGELALKAGLPFEANQGLLNWFSKRFISLCYIALVDYHTIQLKPTEFFESAHWLAVEQAEKLDMDHADILRSAQQFLSKELPYSPIAANLLPPQFTLPDLLGLTEAILNRKIDRPNFRRKILNAGILHQVGMDKTGKRRPAVRYTFKDGKNTSLMDEFKYGF